MATHSSILAWKNLMGRRAWRATVHGVAKSQTEHMSTNVMVRLSNAVRVERGQCGLGKRENHMKNVPLKAMRPVKQRREWTPGRRNRESEAWMFVLHVSKFASLNKTLRYSEIWTNLYVIPQNSRWLLLSHAWHNQVWISMKHWAVLTSFNLIEIERKTTPKHPCTTEALIAIIWLFAVWATREAQGQF